MIIIGYPGIGKSTLAKNHICCIDLESSDFSQPKILNDITNWWSTYINVAKRLSKQGYVVFVSSHQKVQEALEDYADKVWAVYPHSSLKDIWIEKLKNRYEETKLEKDKRAFDYVSRCFDSSLRDLVFNCCRYNYKRVPLRYENYALLTIYQRALNEQRTYDERIKFNGS